VATRLNPTPTAAARTAGLLGPEASTTLTIRSARRSRAQRTVTAVADHGVGTTDGGDG
jgi:hypothetical protein